MTVAIFEHISFYRLQRKDCHTVVTLEARTSAFNICLKDSSLEALNEFNSNLLGQSTPAITTILQIYLQQKVKAINSYRFFAVFTSSLMSY